MRVPLLAALILATACAGRPIDAETASSATPPPAPTETATPRPETPTPTPEPTPEPSPRLTRQIAGLEFAIVAGPADLRLDPAMSRADEALVASTVAADIPAVERDFDRKFAARPLIYAFASTAAYAEGFVRIFGYPRATATFVAENSVAFFEPALRLIAVNWEAVRDRRPIAAIRHELTHLLTLDACTPRCDLVPAWLNEGQARLAEALIPGGDWRLVRVRYEAASMAETGTLIPYDTLASQFSWNSLTDWAGYYKYQQAARAVELLREDVGGNAPIARVYERIRRGQSLAAAYAGLTGRAFEDFLAGLPARMRGILPRPRGIIAVAPEGAPASYLIYGFPPSAALRLTISGPRGSETWSIEVSPYGASFDGLPPTRTPGGYTISAHDASEVFTVRIKKPGAGSPGDTR